MCGIAGIFPKGFMAENELSEKTKKMLSRIGHRGFSSSFGVKSSRDFSLGCVRLPILDEANGDQPMFSENGRVLIVFNGEIYNFEYLKDTYLSDTRFRTGTDTELLANLLEKIDIETVLSLLEGMFSFISFDFINKRYFIARDSVGIKPIYISQNSLAVFAASEIKAFEENLEYIQELPPQHYYDSQSGIKKWEFPISNTDETLRELISKSVKEQVNTHLPVAVFLSGGIDSSVICYEANQYHLNVTAFAIGKKDSNDMICAKKLCEDFNFKFEPVLISEEEVLNAIEETIFCIESFEPNLVRAGTLSFLLSKHVASKGYMVALCGEGADELFASYPDFIEMLRTTDNDYSRLGPILSTFIDELYLTQLRRVDRTGMRFSLEVRPPFLNSQVVAYAKSLSVQERLVYKDGKYITKYPLREAYKEILPSYIVDRVKSVFSEGAGFDANGHHGPFWEHTKKKVSQPEILDIQNIYPEYSLKTHEEVYYFKVFMEYYNVSQIRPKRLHVSTV